MGARRNSVTLKAGGTLQEFETSHAERLLRMANNGGWHLPENSPYQFTKENGITIKSDSRKVKGAEKEAGHTKGN